MSEFIAAPHEVMGDFIATSPGEAAILMQLNNINSCLQDMVFRLSHIEATMKPVTACLHHITVSMQHLHKRVDRVDAALAGAVLEHAGGCGPVGVGWLQHLQTRIDRVDAALAEPVDEHPCGFAPLDTVLHMNANGIGSNSYVAAQLQAHQDLICKVDNVIACLRFDGTTGGDAQLINDFIDSCKELPSASAGRSTDCAVSALGHLEEMVKRGIVWTTEDIHHIFKEIAAICMNLDTLNTGRISM